MPRTTATLVRGILKIKITVDLAPFIESANELVTEVCVPPKKADGITPFHTDVRLAIIEKWLAAHFACVAYRRAIQESAGSVQQTVEGKVDLMLHVTEYGQQAMLMDTSGSLAALNNTLMEVKSIVPLNSGRKKVTWLGTDFRNQ